MGSRQFVAAFLAAVSIAATASEVSWAPSGVVEWRGEIDEDGLAAFQAILLVKPAKGLVLIQSVGGTRRVTKELVAIVRAKSLATSARDSCRSSCALVFLAGNVRTLLPSGNRTPTSLAFHGYYDPKTSALVPPTSSEVAYLVDSTDGGISRALAEKVLNTKSIRGGLIVLASPVDTRAGPLSVMYCDAEPDAKLSCDGVTDQTAESLGIVTPIKIKTSQADSAAR